MPGAVSPTHVRRRQWQRRVGAALAAIAGLVDLVGAFAPYRLAGFGQRELLTPTLQSGTRPLLIIAGVALLLVGRALLRGSRSAWLIALLAASASSLFDVRKDLDASVWLGMAAFAVYLAVTRPAFAMRVRTKRLMWLLPASVGGLVVFGVSVWPEVFEGGPPLGTRVVQTLETAFLFHPPVGAGTQEARIFVSSLEIAGAATFLLALLSLAVPLAATLSTRSRASIAQFVTRFGTTSMAPLTTVAGNRVVELLDGRALVGLQVHGGVAVTVGPPICEEPEEEEEALAELLARCERHGWTPALVGLDQASAERARSAGLEVMTIGHEAIIDVSEFTLSGSRMANVRHSAGRARREGVEVIRYTPDTRSPRFDRAIQAINEAWIESKHGPEMGFTLGSLELDRIDTVEAFVAVAGGEPVALVTWLPYQDGDAAVLDLMRRAPEAPPGTMELLIAESIRRFVEEGRAIASLSSVPLVQLGDEGDGVERLLGWMYQHADALYQAKGLFSFKDKFNPRWEPTFLGHVARTDLPRIGFAIVKAYVGGSLVSELLGSVGSLLKKRSQP